MERQRLLQGSRSWAALGRFSIFIFDQPSTGRREAPPYNRLRETHHAARSALILWVCCRSIQWLNANLNPGRVTNQKGRPPIGREESLPSCIAVK